MARHKECRSPVIFTKTSSRCHRQWLDRIASILRFLISAAKIGQNQCHQARIVS